MAQTNKVDAPVFRYTRADFTALRFLLNKVSPSVIRSKVLTDDDLLERDIETDAQLIAWLNDMRDHLIARASLANPLIAKTLADMRNFNRWPPKVVDMLVTGADKEFGGVALEDAVSVWFRPIVARALKAEGIQSMGHLKAYIERRGQSWYRAIPRIGPGKARAILSWLQKNMPEQHKIVMPTETRHGGLVVLSPDTRRIVPLEHIASVAPQLDGREGRNRNTKFCLISASNDLEAVQTYLQRFSDEEKTYRSYLKELERFLLWCVCRERIPLSSVLTDECERYKAFLAEPDEAWCGSRAPKSSSLWRPFTGKLSAQSQKYAVLVLRGFFAWLVQVRYLQGNPWVTVKDPKVIKRELPMDIHKALPRKLWESLITPGGLLDRVCAAHPAQPLGRPLSAKERDTPAAQYRLARAAMLLMAYTGLRREEAARATRDQLQPVREQVGLANPMWELRVVGKGQKERTVFLPQWVVQAIAEHWADRGHDFSFAPAPLALISPVVVPNTPNSRKKHIRNEAGLELSGRCFSPDGLYQLVKATLLRIAEDGHLPLTFDERMLLSRAAPHAFRHSFATQAAAKNTPIDVLQVALGHASQQTTTIYIQAERTRRIDELAKLFQQYSN